MHNGLASIDAEASDDEDNEASFVPALQPTRALHYPERAGPLAIAINSRAGYKRRARMSKRIADAAIHSARTKVSSFLIFIQTVSQHFPGSLSPGIH